MKRDGTVGLLFSSLATHSSGEVISNRGFFSFVYLNLQVQRQFFVKKPKRNKKELLR